MQCMIYHVLHTSNQIDERNKVKNMMPKFFGTSTIGERGQIVIPSDAREEMGIKPGQKMIFFGGKSMMHMIDAAQFDQIFGEIHTQMNEKIDEIKSKIKEDSEETN